VYNFVKNFNYFEQLSLVKAGSSFPRGLHYKTLRIRNVQQMDKFCNMPVPYIADHKHINLEKHTSLVQNPYIINL
jgi:hypothetical protein